jgi:hypothetical protein
MGNDARARQATTYVPLPGEGGWLTLEDDDLLQRILSLASDHVYDAELIGVVRSERHLFVRQEAARRIRDGERLRALASDRHVGQILTRRLRRDSDVAYLEQLARGSRHPEVCRAAEAQLLLQRPVSLREG